MGGWMEGLRVEMARCKQSPTVVCKQTAGALVCKPAKFESVGLVVYNTAMRTSNTDFL